MATYDVINTSPLAEFQIDAKKLKTPGHFAEPHVPKVKLTWYLTTNFLQPFLETVAPICFVLLCNVRARVSPPPWTPRASRAHPRVVSPPRRRPSVARRRLGVSQSVNMRY